MNINVKEKYHSNYNKYDGYKPSTKVLSKKERAMFLFCLSLLKNNPDKETYDSVIDKEYLENYLKVYLKIGYEAFTIDEWFNFLKNK